MVSQPNLYHQRVESPVDISYLFVYGILKRGFELDLSLRGCNFIGEGGIEGATLRPIGTGVGLRFSKDCEDIAYGEVFEVPYYRWPWLDFIENNGVTYTRKEVEVSMLNGMSPKRCWVYEHTLAGMAYADPIDGGWYGQPKDDHVLPRYDDNEYELGGEA